MKRPSRTHHRLMATTMVALAATGCVKLTGRDPFEAPATRQGGGQIEVRVENLNFGDATIHALRGGERIRLGRVTGKSERRFELSWGFSVSLRFEVDLVGGESCGVPPLTVDPGDSIWLRIPIEIGTSRCDSGKR